MLNGFPIISEYGVINTKYDCPFYSVRASACKDKLYKKCAPLRCNRLQGKNKARAYGQKVR